MDRHAQQYGVEHWFIRWVDIAALDARQVARAGDGTAAGNRWHDRFDVVDRFEISGWLDGHVAATGVDLATRLELGTGIARPRAVAEGAGRDLSSLPVTVFRAPDAGADQILTLPDDHAKLRGRWRLLSPLHNAAGRERQYT